MMSRKQIYYLYFAVFMTGMTTLGVELAASRLLGNIFGTSNLVWASIIGLILIYLTLGYFIGGRWADRSPSPITMYKIMLWGAFLVGLVPVVSKPVLRFAADAFDVLNLGVLFGSFTGVLILFSLPVTLLGTITVFALRLSLDKPEEAGKTSGRIYAISTLGSFLGTFLPVLLLIPLIGTTWTFVVLSLLLTTVAIVGLGISSKWSRALIWIWMPIVLILLGLLVSRSGIKTTAGQIYETESEYNYIQVMERDGYRYLRLNEGQGIHSVYHPTDLRYYGPWMQFLSAPFFNEPPYDLSRVKRVAVVGLAAGTVARQITDVFGPVWIDGYEIDPKIIEVGRKYFGMDMPNLNAHAVDGRWGLEKSQQTYDLVVLDAYRPPYIPWHLTTQEFFQIVSDHLDQDGVVAINVGRAQTDRRMIDALVGTLRTVFPSIYVLDVPNTFNSVIYATKLPTKAENIFQNYFDLVKLGNLDPLLKESIEITALNLQPLPETTTVFTDDNAPVEWITNSMVLDYIFTGDMEVLR